MIILLQNTQENNFVGKFIVWERYPLKDKSITTDITMEAELTPPIS